MIRTQIQLGETEYSALKDVAHRTHRSMADCVREAVAVYLARSHDAAADFRSVAGKFRPVPMDDLKPHDRMLSETLREEGD